MSTKIYGAFDFRSTSLDETYQRLASFRPRVFELQQQALIEFVAKTVCTRLDMVACGQGALERMSALDAVRRELDEGEESDRRERRHPNTDFQFDVSVFVDVNSRGRTCAGVYGKVYTEHNEWTEEFMRHVGAVDFSYWNNSDRPDGVAESEWRRRERVWNKLLPGAGTPRENSLLIEYGDSSHYTIRARVEVEDYKRRVVAALPTLDERVQRRAVDLEVVRKLRPIAANVRSSDFISAHHWATRSEEGQAAVARRAEWVRARLNPKPSFDDLRREETPVRNQED